MDCSGTNSCQNADLNCNDSRCTLQCSGDGACKNLKVITFPTTQSYQCIGDVECADNVPDPAPFALPTPTPTQITGAPTSTPSKAPSFAPTLFPTEKLIATVPKPTTSRPTETANEQPVDEGTTTTAMTRTGVTDDDGDDASVSDALTRSNADLPNFVYAIIGGVCVFCCLAALYMVLHYRRKQREMQREFDKTMFTTRNSSSAKPLKAKYDIVHRQHVNVQHSMNDVDTLCDVQGARQLSGGEHQDEVELVRINKTSEGMDHRTRTRGDRAVGSALDENVDEDKGEDDVDVIDDIDNNVSLQMHEPGKTTSRSDLDVLQDIDQMAITDGYDENAELKDDEEDEIDGNETLCAAPVHQNVDEDVIGHINSLQHSNGGGNDADQVTARMDDDDEHVVDELMVTIK
eukprot:CAMPEP_0202724044 /NCGR_PEP_ID=MMETSP1385-20130828/170573_1 /ASSEMBLY_ACC=CAM_ASM_000861 /TAXON_ID=933848 /ORGANISM="Elphidium margaritaceum" /LENGTH=403 /DNA_ID=CAMNT_0049389487 /DNA_START=194 /DNA_END=1405 /DNA_ORIENTATION=-